MSPQTNINFFLNWANERVAEMDAALHSLEGKTGQVQLNSRGDANKIIDDLRQKRDAFRDEVAKQATVGEAAWKRTMAELETQWHAFELGIDKYIDNFGRQIQQQQATFHSQVAAQLKAWREIADKINVAASEFAVDPRSRIEASATRMKAEAASAEKKLQKLVQAGTEPWSVLNATLAETRDAFDRANQAAQETIKQAIGSHK